jgi:hypothetical protein
MRRRRLLQGVGVLILLLGLAGYVLPKVLIPAPQPGVTRDNFYRLRQDMTEAEVLALLGFGGEEIIETVTPIGLKPRQWDDKKSLRIVLYFDRQGRVAGGDLIERGSQRVEYIESLGTPRNGSVFDRLRAWLGW